MKCIDILCQEKILGTIEWDGQNKYYQIINYDRFDNDIIKQLYYLSLNKINIWVGLGKLPYPMPREEMFPWEDDWWIHIKKFMIHAIKFGDIYEK